MRESKLWPVVRLASGNFLEMYDFMVFGYLGMLMSTMTIVCFYMITAYTPTFGGSVLHLANSRVQIVILCVGVANFIWLPVMGALSDRPAPDPARVYAADARDRVPGAAVARRRAVIRPAAGRRALALPCMFGGYNGAMVVYLIEIMPRDVRTSGFSVAFSLATAIFGGFTPAICTYLIEITGNRAVPGLWLSFAATLGLVAVLALNCRAVVSVDLPVPVVAS